MQPSRTLLPVLQALLLLASSAGAQRTLFDLSGPALDAFGRSCDVVGDTDDDGFGEFLVGARVADNGTIVDAGSASLYSGASGNVLATFLGADTDDRLGFQVRAAGDVDRDGRADFLLPVYLDDVPFVGREAGSVQLVSGASRSVLRAPTGAAENELFGRSVGSVGDVDRDGHDDVFVFSPGADTLTILAGYDGSEFLQVPVEPRDGPDVASVGDVNGDGVPEFVVEQNRGVQAGWLVRVVSGADWSELWNRDAGLEDPSVAGAGDANGDGVGDVLVGSPAIDGGRGRVRLYSGPDGAVLHEVFGTAPLDRLGDGLAGAGDLDADGHADFVAGLPGFDGAAGLETGAVRAYSGRTGAVLATIEGRSAGDALGASVGAGHDVDGDGIPDAIAGPPAVLFPSAGAQASVKVVSFVPRGLEPFGKGTAGCRGTSTLLANGVPAVGSTSFALHASNVGAAPLLLVGDTADDVGALHFGARFHLDFSPPPPALGLVFQVRLADPAANGSLVAPLPIPANPALLGQTFVFQVASLFPPGTCAQRLTTSRGLRVTFQ